MVRLKQRRRLDRESSNKRVKTTPFLPDDIIEKIFTFLPVKNAVKMGVLAKRYTKSFLQTRRIIFDRDLVRSWGRERVMKTVSKFFNSYEGSEIKSFKLCFSPNDDVPIVETWLATCIEKGVEELDLDFFISSRITVLGYDTFDIKSLRSLKLTFCHFDLLPNFTGLKFLKTLTLRRVFCASKMIEAILSNSLCLETLDMIGCYFISCLKIMAQKLHFFKTLKVANCLAVHQIYVTAPSLRSFHYCGNILRFFRMENVGKLDDVLLNFKPLKNFNIHDQITKLAQSVSRASVLTTTSVFLEGLSLKLMGGILRFDLCFWNLREFNCLWTGANFCNMYDVVSFMRHCPMLEKLFLDLGDYSFECGEYYKLHQKDKLENFGDTYNCLKIVKIKGFKFRKLEIELVKYLLRRANNLENMVLVRQRCNRKAAYIRELHNHMLDIETCRVSPLTCIEAYERFDDKSFIVPTHSHRIWD